jgi:hypothetical protein
VKDAKHGTPRDTRRIWYVSYRQYPGLMRSLERRASILT